VEHVNATAAIDESVLGTFANARSFSATMLLDRDYKWCAETMLYKFGSSALGRVAGPEWQRPSGRSKPTSGLLNDM
jgi:hypothetical protein